MRAYLDCLPCFLRQALDAARRVSDDERDQHRVICAVSEAISGFSLDATPIDLGRDVHRIVREVTGVDDPYLEAKRRDNSRAIALLPDLREKVATSTDPIRMSLRLAALGNTIDLGVYSSVDIHREIEQEEDNEMDMEDYPLFRERLDGTDKVLYLGDNAGEIAFDRLVVEQLTHIGKRVTFAVRGRPILNDATIDDAIFVGMNDVAEVISSGADAPGTVLHRCLPEFAAVFETAEVILSKGQGNFEGLSEECAPLFFLLKAKCPVVAGELGVAVGEMVLRAQRTGRTL